jgi:hypothetical protein
MPVTVDASLGALYVEPEKFLQQATAFGCKKALDALGAESTEMIQVIIASASRQIDAYCQSQGFSPDEEIFENHRFDLRTRRVPVNSPPVVELISFGVRTGPQSITSFGLTPVGNGADNKPVSWGAVYYNKQENYLELSSLSVAGNQVSTLISLGLMEVQAEFKYKNGTALKPNVIAATYWQTAHLLNSIHTHNNVVPGIVSMSSPEMSITYEQGLRESRQGAALHPMAVQLLGTTRRIAIA